MTKVLLDKYSRPNNSTKPYFSEYKEGLVNLKRDAEQIKNLPNPTMEQLVNAEIYAKMEAVGIEGGIDKILEVNAYLRALLDDYDAQLHQVITRHEDDFLGAYKTHMVKVEKQLQLLKDKAKEQENKLNNDERIVKMEK